MSFTLELPDEAASPAAQAPQAGGGGFTLELPDDAAPAPAPAARQGNAANGGVLSGLGMGLMDPIHAGAQMLTNALPTGVVQAGNRFNNWLADNSGLVARIPEGGVDQMVRDREAQYQADRAAAGRTGLDAGRLAGGVAATLPAAMIPGAATIGGSAAIGAGMGALQPVTAGEFWVEKMKQAGLGAAAGGAGGAISQGISRILSPQTGAAQRMLMAEGVELTPGQVAGGLSKRFEDAATSVPIMGGKVAQAQQRAVESFNRAAINRGLGEIGEKLPDGMVGREAIEYAGKKIGDAYDPLLARMTLRADQQFIADSTALAQNAQAALAPDRAQQLANILQTKLGRHMSGQGTMTGQKFKLADSELGRLARQFSSSADADQRMLGETIRDMQSVMRDALARSNPRLAPELRKIDKAFATNLRVERAASSVAATDGVFTPAQLQNAVKALDSSGRKRQFARGNALLQDLADAGKEVLPSAVGNSGTADRAGLMAMGGALATGQWWAPMAAGVGAAAYTRPGIASMRALLTQRPAVAGTIAELLERGAPIPLTAGGYQLLNQ